MKDFILKVPKWEGEIYFSADVITLMLVIAALVGGILLCFWGYRYFQALALILLGCVCGFVGYKIGSDMTTNEVLQMCIFVIFTFLGVCLFYLLSNVWVYIMVRLGLQSFLQRTLHIIASLAGAMVIGGVTYNFVYRNIVVVCVLAVVFAVCGIWHGMRSIKARRVFHTYEDLSKRKPLAKEEADA